MGISGYFAGRGNIIIRMADQDMTINKIMRLQEDLNVHADYVHSGIYNRFTPSQKQAFYDYYENKVSKEFDTRHDTGRALVRWKYERYLKDYLSVARSMDRNIGQLHSYLDEVNNFYGHAGYEALTAGLKSTLKDLIRQYKDEEAEKILEEKP